MTRPSQENKIIEAALECFAEKGFEGTRIRHIAEKAQVTEGALYRHYASKEEIAQAIFKYYFDQFSLALQAVAGSGETVPARLGGMIRTGLKLYRQNPAAFQFVVLRPPGFKPELGQKVVYPVEIVEAVILNGQQEGVIRPGRPNLLAAIFLGCLLRPIIVANGAAPGALDLLNETEHDQVIEEAALSAVMLHPVKAV